MQKGTKVQGKGKVARTKDGLRPPDFFLCTSHGLLALVFATGTALAGLSSLKIAPGIREAGMGGAGVAGGQGPQALAWNPAIGVDVTGFSIAVSGSKWLLDSHLESVHLVRNLGFMHLGLGITSFNAGRFEYRTDVPTEKPLREFVPSEMDFHLNFCRRFGRIAEAGISGRYYFAKVMDYEAGAPGVDLGVRVRPAAGFAVGAALVDFGRNLCFYRVPFRLPTRARLGLCYQFDLGEFYSLSFAGQGTYSVYVKKPGVQAGAEFSWRGLAFLRSGCNWSSERTRLDFGLGVRSNGLRFDYAFAPSGDDLGAAHRFSLGFDN